MTQADDRKEARGKLIIISGPSGVGKSTICREVVRRTGAVRSVSATTRSPRADEVDGRDYYFVGPERFREMIDGGELLEWAEVFGNRYGTPAAPVRRAVGDGRIVVLEIDVQGGVQVFEKAPDATFILLLPPGREELERRLRGRRSESEPSLARRLAKAEMEIEIARASGAYKNEVVNDDLETAIRQVVDIINQESGGT